MSGKGNVYGSLILIGGILAVVALFLDWQSVSVMGTKVFSLTGWDIYTEGGDGSYEYYYIPLVLLALAAVAILASLVELARSSKALGALCILVSVLIIVLPVFLMSDLYSGATGYSWTDDLAAGFYMIMVAGILVLIGSVASMLKSD